MILLFLVESALIGSLGAKTGIINCIFPLFIDGLILFLDGKNIINFEIGLKRSTLLHAESVLDLIILINVRLVEKSIGLSD